MSRASLPSPPLIAETISAQRDRGPQDRGFYGCACGHGFRAPVGLDVACPRCGDVQAW